MSSKFVTTFRAGPLTDRPTKAKYITAWGKVIAMEATVTKFGICSSLEALLCAEDLGGGERRYRPQTVSALACITSATHNVDIGHKLINICKINEYEMLKAVEAVV